MFPRFFAFLLAALIPLLGGAAPYVVGPAGFSWESRLPNDYYGIAAVQADANGDLIVAGTAGDPAHFYLAKLSGFDGQKIWEYEEPAPEPRRYPSRIAIDANGDVSVVFRHYPVSWRMYGIAKFSGVTGQRLWRSHVTTPEADGNVIFAMAPNQVGDVAITGYVAREGATQYEPQSFYTAKFASATGALQWETRAHGGYALAWQPDGNLLIDYAQVLANSNGALLQPQRSGTLHHLYFDPQGDVIGSGAGGNELIFFKLKASDAQAVWYRRVYASEGQASLYAHDTIAGPAGHLGFSAHQQGGLTSFALAGVVAPDSTLLWTRRFERAGTEGFGNPAIAFDARGDLLCALQGEQSEPAYARNGHVYGFHPATGAELFHIVLPGTTFGSGTRGTVCALPDGGFAVAGTNGSGANPSFVKKYVRAPAIRGNISGAVTAGNTALQATVSPVDVSFHAHFEWGDSAYGNTLPATLIPAFHPEDVTLSADLGKLPPGTYHFRLVFSSTQFETVRGDDQVVVVPNVPPVAVDDVVSTTIGAPILLDLTANDGDENAGDSVSLHTWATAEENLHGTLTFTDGKLLYQPERDFLGTVEFSYTIRDSYLASAEAKVTVAVGRPADPLLRLLAVTGAAVPGGREGERFVGFTNAGAVPFLAQTEVGTSRDEMLIDRSGQVALAADADIKWGVPIGTVTLGQYADAQAKAGDDLALFGRTEGGRWEKLVREGDAIDGLAVERFLAIDGTAESAVYFLAMVRGDDVMPANNLALFASTQGQPFRKLVRKGDLVDGKKVTAIAVLTPSAHSAAEGRWVQGERILVRLTLAGGTHVLFAIPANSASQGNWVRLAATGDTITLPGGDADVRSLGFPAAAPQAFAYLASARQPKARAMRTALVLDRGQGAEVQAWVGQPQPDKSTIAALGDPMLGAQGRIAFEATLRPRGAGPETRAIFYGSPSPNGLPIVARTRAAAAGIVGARWSAFRSIAVADGAAHGLAFTASLEQGRGGVNRQNDLGLWATDSAGALRLALRTGQKISFSAGERQVATFSALSGAAPHGASAARGYDSRGYLYVHATFTDRTQAVYEIVLP